MSIPSKKLVTYVELQVDSLDGDGVETNRTRAHLRDEIAQTLGWTAEQVQTTVEQYARLLKECREVEHD